MIFRLVHFRSFGSNEGDRKEAFFKGRILLVDDSADVRTYIKNILSKYWSVELSTNGEEAYQMALESHPDLILTDAMMPIMDGFELISRLRENPATKHLPIIMLSARAGEESKTEGLTKGADDYLVKTAFSAKELIARVKVHLELGSLRSKLEKEVSKRTEELKKMNEKLQEEIKERQKTEEALLESNKRIEFLMSVAPVGIYRFDAQGQFKYINLQAADTFWLSLEQFKQGKWIEVVHPEDRESVVNEWHAFLANKQRVFQLTYRLLSPTGEIRWVYSQAKAEYAQNNILGYTATTTDITYIKKLEIENLQALSHAEEQQRLRAQEAEANKNRQSEFIDTLCHEIRNPLNGIVGCVEILLDKIEAMKSLLAGGQSNANALLSYVEKNIADFETMVSSIRECGAQQTTLVNEVLNFSKLESGNSTINAVSFAPRKLVDSVIDIYKAQIIKKSLNIVLSIDENIIVKGDADKIKDILINLISNSIKFTSLKGTIKISLSFSDVKTLPIQVKLEASDKDKDCIKSALISADSVASSKTILQFTLEDTGIGMSEIELLNIFKPYRQANQHISKRYGGTGLGLTISQKLVKLLGGDIHATSQEGKGTSFTFTVICEKLSPEGSLAFGAPNKTQVRYSLFASQPEPHKKYKIMIVEDNILNQNLLVRFLEKKDYEYVIADDGQKAIDYFEPGKFDLIFMDLIMPNVGGFEATQKIREKENLMNVIKAIPIIGLSGNAREENWAEAVKSGMNDFVSKPIKSTEIYALIEKWTNEPKERTSPSM